MPAAASDNSKHKTNQKNNYDLYSEQSEAEEDRGDSSEEEISDELISSEDYLDERDLKGNHDKNKRPTTSHATTMPAAASDNSKNKTLITSSEAIGSSIIKSIPVDSGWQSRRSESEVVLSRIKRKSSLLKRPRARRRTTGAVATVNSLEDDTPRRRTIGGEVVQQQRRTTLRFAAAPVAVSKRKKQMSLKSMFQKG